jgi:hypothetical protein
MHQLVVFISFAFKPPVHGNQKMFELMLFSFSPIFDITCNKSAKVTSFPPYTQQHATIYNYASNHTFNPE